VFDLDRAFIYALPLAIVSFVASFALKEVKLRSSTGAEDREPSAEPMLG
jgi:hypothetical protein